MSDAEDIMADMEKDRRPEDEQDTGVKIEIHGEDDPSDERKPETEDPENASSAAGEQQTAGAGEDDPGTGDKSEAADRPEAGDKPDDADIAPADAEEEEAGGTDEEKDKSGKGFFGFKAKKDKKDEKIAELTDRVQRQMAEFDNFRKRTEREKATMFDMGKKDAIEKILPVVDSFERGLGDSKEETDDPFRQGMQKVYKQLMTALEGMGVKPIEAEGKEFDPNFHNAVMHCEDDSVGENIVVQELQKGYMMNDTVIRHSMVKVAN